MFVNRRLWALMDDARGSLIACVAIGVAASVVGIARLALLGWLIGRVFNGAEVEELLVPMGAVAGVMALRGVLEHWRTMLAHRTAAKVQLGLRKMLHAKVLALGPAYFGSTRTGDVLLAVVEGVEQLEVWFGEYLPQIAVATITPVVIFALLAPFDLVIASILLVFAWVTLIAPSAFHRWDVANSLRRKEAYSAFAADFLDSLQGLATLKAFGQSEARGVTLAARAHEVFRSTMWVLATNSLTRGITDTGLAVGAAVALGVGAFRVQSGEMSLEILLMVLLAGIEVFRPQRDLRSLLHNGMLGMSAAESIFNVLDAKPPVEPNILAPRQPQDLSPSVEFENVAFTYPGARREAHSGLTFDVRPGEHVGVVGASGAGKSTIIKLLLRLYDADTGSIKLGGVDVASLHPDDLYRTVAVVSQDTFLFHGSVEDNIRFGCPDATPEAVHQAALDANADEFIAKLPDGYATVIGERGIRLSGGQRQRIAIARALLRDAPLLVLDEALSAVDAHNESIINEALARLMENRTTLVFAHRLSSIIGADRIVVLDDGKVVEEGTHESLVTRNGRYSALMGDQLERGNAPSAETSVAADPEPAAEVSGTQGAEASMRSGIETLSRAGAADDVVRAEGLTWTQAISILMKSATPWRAKLVATFVFGITRVAALIGVGVLSAMVVGALKRGEPFEVWLWALAIAAPVAGIVHWFESWVAHDMAFRMLAEMRVALYRKLDELAPAYLVRRRTGDLVAMATHDVEMVEYFFAHTMAPAFVAILVPVLVLAVLGSNSWLLAAALVPFLVLVAISPFTVRRRLDNLGSTDREALGDLNAFLVDTIQGLAEVLMFQQASAREAAFVERVQRHMDARGPFYHDLSIQSALLEALTGLGGLAVVATGAHLVGTGALDSSILPLLTLVALASFLPMSEIAHIGRQLADTLGATRRLHQVHSERAAVEVPAAPRTIDPEHDVALNFEDVTFRYPGTITAAVSTLSLRLERGTSLALVGPSGAGKSTIAQLAMRFWDVTEGSVSLFGQPLTELDPQALRSHVALVSQETYLFNETLGANILMARPDATEAELERAVQNASLVDFVDSLPDGLNTAVGERGARLSGGQRQRVAIARAFLKDAPVLILDEATSHLDAVNEAAVHRSLETLMKNRTTIIIAHRLSTVRGADTILVLDEGRVMQRGTHSSLMAVEGAYKHLVARQVSNLAGGAPQR
jgi:ATP-binding cassette, subfamily B, bacterial